MFLLDAYDLQVYFDCYIRRYCYTVIFHVLICTYIHSQQKGALNCAASTASFIFVSVANARDESSELLPRNALSAHPRTPEARYFYKFWVLVETAEMSSHSALVFSFLKKRKKKREVRQV